MPAPSVRTVARLGERVAGVLPPAFICGVAAAIWSIYLALHLRPLLQLDAISDDFRRDEYNRGVCHTVISQTLTAVLVICYLKCVFCPPGTVPSRPEWILGHSEAPVPFTREVKFTGERRHCKWCLKYKPDRCHHCRVCKSCVLKMDHHCPWIMNCVGFNNHKYFFLLLVYAVVDCIFISATLAESVQRAIDSETPAADRFLLVFGVVLAAIMSFFTSVFLGFHTYLMLKGMTTIEFCEKSVLGQGAQGGAGKSRYSLGFHRNLNVVLGENPLLWLVPIATPVGDGLYFRDGEDEGCDPEWTGPRRGADANASLHGNFSADCSTHQHRV